MTASKAVALPLGDSPIGWVLGLEPRASRATIWRANQLRHTHHTRPNRQCRLRSRSARKDSLRTVPEGIRTPDPRLRRPLLYPAELLAQHFSFSREKRVMGIEPTCPAWKAGVLAIVLHPQNTVFSCISGFKTRTAMNII